MFTCPFCGHSSHYLWQVGHSDKVLIDNEVVGGGRRYAKCIRCGSTDRDRLVYLYLRDHTNLLKNTNDRVLHIAPERMLKKVLKHQFPSGYIAADKFTRGYHYAKDTIAMDITNIRFDDNTFDLIVCNHVLEHIVNDRAAIAELYRVLKPGGIAILQVPVSKKNKVTIEDTAINTPRDRKLHYGQHDHVRIYGQDYTDRLKKSGLIVERAGIAAQYPDAALNKDELVFVGRK